MYIFNEEIMKKVFANLDEDTLIEIANALDGYEDRIKDDQAKFGVITMLDILEEEISEFEKARRDYEPLTHPDNS